MIRLGTTKLYNQILIRYKPGITNLLHVAGCRMLGCCFWMLNAGCWMLGGRNDKR
jgi:hypothetical protein